MEKRIEWIVQENRLNNSRLKSIWDTRFGNVATVSSAFHQMTAPEISSATATKKDTFDFCCAISFSISSLDLRTNSRHTNVLFGSDFIGRNNATMHDTRDNNHIERKTKRRKHFLRTWILIDFSLALTLVFVFFVDFCCRNRTTNKFALQNKSETSDENEEKAHSRVW